MWHGALINNYGSLLYARRFSRWCYCFVIFKILKSKAVISSLLDLSIDKLFSIISDEKRLSKLTSVPLNSQIFSNFAFKKVLASWNSCLVNTKRHIHVCQQYRRVAQISFALAENGKGLSKEFMYVVMWCQMVRSRTEIKFSSHFQGAAKHFGWTKIPQFYFGRQKIFPKTSDFFWIFRVTNFCKSISGKPS